MLKAFGIVVLLAFAIGPSLLVHIICNEGHLTNRELNRRRLEARQHIRPDAFRNPDRRRDRY